MSKPATPAVWATDANYTIGPTPGEPTKVTPSSTKIAQGFEPDEKPAPENLNQRLNLIGQWTEYLDSGQFEGNISIDGDLSVTGDLTLDNDVSIGGDLDVTGLITADGGLTAGANQSIEVSGTGDFYHGDTTDVLSGSDGVGDNVTYSNGTSGATGDSIESTGGDYIRWRIPLRPGHRISALTFAVWGNGVADITAYNLVKMTAAGTTTTIGTGSVTNPTNAWTDVPVTVTATTLAAGQHFFFEVLASAAGIAINSIRITYSRPRP